MSTEKHDQPAVPEGSAAYQEARPDATPQAVAPQADPAPVPAPPGPPAQPSTSGNPGSSAQPVQTVSAPHPQGQPTQELHPQEYKTTPYPQYYGEAQRPAPYGHYAAGPYGRDPYAGHSASGAAPRVPYPQQTPTPQYGYPQQAPGSAFGAAAAHAAAGDAGSTAAHGDSGIPGAPGEPGAGYEQRHRKPRGWVPLVGVAALAALLASGGTALVFNARDDGSTSTSISQIGDPGRVDTAPVQESTTTNPDWTAVAAAVQQSVVAINTTTAEGTGLGSGLILDAEGHVLTNNHVVSGATNDTVQVTLSDGRVFDATIVGADATTDLAVVRLVDAPEGLVPVALGDSDAVSVGDSVLAVGNPLGLANTATTGIVSALDRPVVASGENTSEQVVTNAIQIDAAINPGNSGGPLFNAQGQVIGITSSIATLSSGMASQSGSIGLGFAIPVNLAKNISDQLIENGSAQHAFLGVSLNDGTATADGVTRRGALVGQVTAGSPAAEAGVQAGDVVVAIGDQPVTSAASLTGFVREYEAGQTTTLTLVRNGQSLELSVTLAVRDESAQQQAPEEQPGGQAPGQQPGGDGSGGGSDQGSGNSDGGSLWDRLFGE